MRIRVDDPGARRELASALKSAGCTTLPIGQTLEVVHHAGDALAVRFFLRAWQDRHPRAGLEIVS